MIGIRNKLFTLLMILAICIPSFADCDWTQIKQNSNGTYTYTEDLHLCVGQLVKDNQTKDQQISDLTKAITMKDLALKDSDERATLWMGTSEKLETRVQKLDGLEKTNEWVYFGLGVVTTFAAGYMAAKLLR